MTMRNTILLLLLCSCSSPSPAVLTANAQPVGPNGLPRVLTIDGGICLGAGTSSDPLACSFAHDVTISGTGSAGSPLSASADFVASAFFCDGSDGSAIFDGTSTVLGMVPSGGTYTMTRDICCANCTINAGVSVTGAWRFFDSGTLTLNGKIHRNGSNAAANVAGAGSPGGTTTNHFEAGGNGGNGNTGVGTAGAGRLAPLECSDVGGAANGGAGSACKGGGGGNGTNAGAAGGSMFPPGSGSMSAIRSVYGAESSFTNYIAGQRIQVGTGGGGGGGDGTVAGGGGGGGGGQMFVALHGVSGSGSIESRGGNGGNGNASGNTGGGGGGGGGIVTVVIGSGSFPTISVAGGSGGLPGGTGVAGGNGGSGIAVQLRVGG